MEDGLRGSRRGMSDTERDPAHPTPEELAETARSEGLAASEEETDPEFEADYGAEEPAPPDGP